MTSTATEKLGAMTTAGDVHTVMVMVNKVSCRRHHSVNEPLKQCNGRIDASVIEPASID